MHPPPHNKNFIPYLVHSIRAKALTTILISSLLLLTACSPQISSSDLDEDPELLRLYSTSATVNWVPPIYDCAKRTQLGLVARTPNIDEADISLRIGTFERGYEIDEMALTVIGNSQNSVGSLSHKEVENIFAGKISNWAEVGGKDAPIRLWVYDKENDLQKAFSSTILRERTTSTMARQAQNAEEMRQEIAQDTYAIGIGTQEEAGTNLRILYTVGNFPVLAVAKDEPQGIVFAIINCLQEE